MNNNNEPLAQARALQADILAAPAVWLPRRENMLLWLSAFVQRASAPKYELGETETADLVALDLFLRKKHLPVA